VNDGDFINDLKLSIELLTILQLRTNRNSSDGSNS